MSIILQTLVNSLITSSFYMLIAVGLTLVFGVMNIANFAHGEFYMVGAYTVWLLYSVGKIPFFVSVLVALVVVCAIGVVAERVLFRRVYGNVLGGFIISIGLVFILQVLVGQIWGVGMMKPVPKVFPGSLSVLGISVGWQRFIVVPCTGFLLAVLWFFLAKTKTGRGLRAVAQDREAAILHGIDVNRCCAVAMGLGSAMAAAGGALMAPIVSVYPYMGHSVVWTGFVIVIVGGAGNIKGTILSALFFGFLHTIVATVLDSTIGNLVGVLCMLIILAIKPEGLAGERE
ncbi:branched-chain amino acid ABC transporter permease [Candidatus Fermentibacteria bacterium]|nr:branched-chain amino acid ABC transporter permease [Candidatus Fermentibacteria bacterium]